ncbi:sulfate adenylyltransferase subunit 2 [Pseudidiomarina salinarum]|uniref:Sulfate adenylyltransferase subunit 2 n=1 Tax=Pseudidiomarina salinarum TaxID=435908 RepID=A0A094L999_9GAMM|nr:sulfate adenylyltransferase subunit CysD [Pseudidiomarina salinarum]KFZ31368.1 sulfate adenylyltransferase subunit 2 [Pseudidiomarina salinarum]RUO70873.1 sulfate adenylyltransferase subunit CysD [Pseudidiomarina salinarum]
MLTHLQRLEAEAIHIFREVMAEFQKPVLLYSVGKDSSVLLHLARKAFAPGPVPFPLLHIDTGWKFREMIAFRDRMAAEHQLQLIVHTNETGRQNKVSPFSMDQATYTDIMKTQALRQALSQHQFDAAFGGARRDEEMSRAKERIYSFRDKNQRWDPRNQRPELWNLYNGHIHKGESIRVFPLSNWTELDIWQYIAQEQIAIPELYFVKPRPIVKRGQTLIMQDDDRMVLEEGEKVTEMKVRFRTLGCYPLTGAIESDADSLDKIIEELKATRRSERSDRLIDKDAQASMEKKKTEGYF